MKLIYPLNYSVIYFAITKPSPIPLEFIYSVFYKKPKSLNNLSWSYSSMPTPESSTEIYKKFRQDDFIFTLCDWIS